jgi:hypothetical protein
MIAQPRVAPARLGDRLLERRARHGDRLAELHAEASFRDQQDLIGAVFGLVGAQLLVSAVGSDAPRLVFLTHAAIGVAILVALAIVLVRRRVAICDGGARTTPSAAILQRAREADLP